MKWTKPKPTAPSAAWYLDGEDGWRIAKSLTNGVPVYTLSHRGVLVMSGSLDACKGRADSDRQL